MRLGSAVAILDIDGAQGEGGGQIIRSALTLSALTRRAIRITRIRAGRPKPGLAAQHVTAVRAAAAICAATVTGDAIGSRELVFARQTGPLAGSYLFDVAEARAGGSAGATMLVLQTLLPALAAAEGVSELELRGGTHVPWSPPFDFVHDAWLTALGHMGIRATAVLERWGFYPAGGGIVRARVDGLGSRLRDRLRPLDLVDRGELAEVTGRAVAANLPAHIPQRMTDRARALLEGAGIACRIAPERVRATSPGAGIFLSARYEGIVAGFSALGAPGKPSEIVAEEAAQALIAHRDSGAVLDAHLSDQILLPATLALGPSQFSVERITRHLETNAWVLGQFGATDVRIERRPDGTGLVSVIPRQPRE